MKLATEHTFTGTTALIGSYDATKTMIGTLIKQFTGATPEDKYISVQPPLLSNNLEATLQSWFCPKVYQWKSDIYWIFSASNATAAVTRNISLHEYNSTTHTITWKGFVTLSGTTIAGAKTIRGFDFFVTEHTTGTVSTSGSSTTITGSGSAFQTDRIAVGARIGFGTTDPTAVTTWYEITAIASDTSLTINSPVTLAPGTAYVIEEIRLAVTVTNATLYLSGTHLIKGLNYGTFTSGGTVITEATATDSLRTSVLLRDKAPQTVTVTIASPGVFTATGHGYVAGDAVSLSTTGALPTGLTVNTTYYVIATGLTANDFQLSATLGGAAINTTGSQSGTHTLYSNAMAITMGSSFDEAGSSATNQDFYVLNNDNATTTRVLKFNLRAALSISAGISYSAFTHKTLGLATVGTVQQVGNGRIFTVNHGAASGVKSLYFVTASRVYRCAVADLTANSSSWLSDFMLENPPGTIATNLATSAMLQIDYSSTLDRLLISTTLTGRHGVYMAKYDTASPQFEKIFGQISNRTKLTTTDAGAPDAFFNPSALTMWTESGILFAMPNVVTSGLNWLGVLHVGAEGSIHTETDQYIITPKMSTANASQLYRLFVHTNQQAGDSDVGYTPEPINVWFRTEGIDDDSGAWTQTVSGDLSGVTPGDYIQAKIALDILGELCIPRKIYAVCVTYEDGNVDSQDSHYLSAPDFTDSATKTFAWKHQTAFGSAVPRLKIRLYNAITGGILDTDDSTTQNGTWEKTTNSGGAWGAYNTSDKGNETTFIRFTPASIPDNVQVRALLTLY